VGKPNVEEIRERLRTAGCRVWWSGIWRGY
jgi:hypothetical protein